MFNALARVAKATWGLSCEAIEIIYKGAFLSRLTYGPAAWHKAAEGCAIRRKLSTAQRCALLRLTKAYRTTSTEALQIIAGTLPLDLILNERATLYHCRRGKNIVVGNKEYSKNEYKQRPKLDELPKPYNRKVIQLVEQNEEWPLKIYTDGSKVNMKMEAAFLAIRDNKIVEEKKFQLGDACSVFQAELIAIERAVQWLAELNITAPTIVYSDIRAALCTLEQFNDTNYTTVNIKRLTEQFNLKTQFAWVKAHAGNPGNERVDRLVKETTLLTEMTYKKIPITSIKNEIRKVTYHEWQDLWTKSTKGRNTFWLLPCEEERMTELRWHPFDHILSQLYTGH
ncbi:uncharacterized protein LOC111639203 [Centruroides sculpturatus]|uniref:uncharacterized protein LOC111639203 n=1 Tax=Centruroides sculpturatus TaxID=218467 RepID=UPI000C6E16EA|nr:uncharacterized protein LOC111639203 [Centruroides sculpturatus]